MNLTCILATLATICFKVLIKEGVTVASVLIGRNITLIVLAWVYLLLRGQNPFKEFPCVKKSVIIMGIRTLTG